MAAIYKNESWQKHCLELLKGSWDCLIKAFIALENALIKPIVFSDANISIISEFLISQALRRQSLQLSAYIQLFFGLKFVL